MKKFKKSLVRDGSRIEDAMDIFLAAMEFNELTKLTIKDWGPVELACLTDPEGWLGIWMLKSDELASSLLKCRLWNTVYIKDNNSVQGIKPVNRDELLVDNDATDLYDQFPLASDIGVPASLRFLIANVAFVDSLNISGNQVSIKPVRGFYSITGELAAGDVLPFHERDKLNAYLFNQYMFDIKDGINPAPGADNAPSSES